MRQLRQEANLATLVKEHFHLGIPGIPALDWLLASFRIISLIYLGSIPFTYYQKDDNESRRWSSQVDT